MSPLLCKPDLDAVRARLTNWWHGGDIGRPVMLITAPRATPLFEIPERPAPPGWVTDYSTSDFAYRVYLTQRRAATTLYLGDTVPAFAPDLAPNCLALYLGCHGVETPGTVWCEPCLDPAKPESAVFAYQPDNFYWDFSMRLGREQKRLGAGKWLLQFPDLIEGLDTLAAMRGTQDLLVDLVDRPEWVERSLAHITQLYFRYYDALYDLLRDDVGGSHFWCWAPGRMAKFQCDFSAMISPAMFGRFMVPVLREMTARVSHCMYHWDGPGALPHHDHLLSLPRLGVIQWTPGDGIEPAPHPRWWKYFHKTVDAGKGVMIWANGADELRALKKEFSRKLNRFIIAASAQDERDAGELIEIAAG